MPFEPVKRTRVPDQVAASIRDAIFGGAYAPGDALPAERALAGQFGVNRSSVREALRRLEAWGLVEIRHGGGTRVAHFLETAGLHLLPFLLAPGGQLDLPLVVDLLSVRVPLLGFTAASAAQQRTPEGVETLGACLATMETADSPIEAQAAEYAFFEAMVAISGNRVLALLSNAIRRAYLDHAELFVAMYGSSGADLSHHRAALHAITVGDADAAREAMASWGRVALEQVQP